MTGKEILLAALRCERTPRPAWLPFVGVHGGKLLGVKAPEYLKTPQLMVRGLQRARELYQPDGLPVMFDLQIEAEVLGCELRWAEEVPPSVASHPLASGTLPELPAFSTDKGRFPVIAEVLAQTKTAMGEEVALYGLVTGPFTLTAHLRGHELFLDMIMQPEKVHEIMQFATDVACKTAKFYLDYGADVIAAVDPMVSQISPQHFDEFVAPHVNRLFDYVRGQRGYSSMFVCGDATRNLDAMCRTNCDNIQIDENIALPELRRITAARGKSFGGNIRLTTVLLLGAEDDAKLDAIRCIDQGGDTGFVLAPGCDLPYGTPEKNLAAVAAMAHDPYQRDVARSLTASSMDDFSDLVLPDYEEPSVVTLDVVTLDSAACPPCLYMVQAVESAVARANVPTVMHEHKIRHRDGIGHMVRLGVKHIPTICIDGTPRYESVIPDVDTLVRDIQARYRKKRRP